MENISDTLNKKNYSTKVINNLSNYSSSIPRLKADDIVAQAADLIDNPDFKPYFFRTLYMIGIDKFTAAMSIARQANAACRPCFFAKTLKNMRDEVSG